MKPYKYIIPLLMLSACAATQPTDQPMDGRYLDDYGNQYDINDSLFTQMPHGRFHLVEWHRSDQFVIARNDSSNSSDPGLWTRIDWMHFSGMEPYTWGFCFTAYRAPDRDAARATSAPDRTNPRTGCNGYPFSRMRSAEGIRP
jgi:hypothetical protein